MCIFHSFVSIKIYNTLLYFYYEMYCYQFSTIPLFQKFDHMTTNLKLLWRNHRFWRNIFSNYIHILKKVVYKLTDKLFFFCIEQEYFKTKLEKCEGLGLVCVGTICFMYLLLLPIALTFTKWTITGIAKTKISLCNWLRRKIFWLELPTQCQTPFTWCVLVHGLWSTTAKQGGDGCHCFSYMFGSHNSFHKLTFWLLWRRSFWQATSESWKG